MVRILAWLSGGLLLHHGTKWLIIWRLIKPDIFCGFCAKSNNVGLGGGMIWDVFNTKGFINYSHFIELWSPFMAVKLGSGSLNDMQQAHTHTKEKTQRECQEYGTQNYFRRFAFFLAQLKHARQHKTTNSWSHPSNRSPPTLSWSTCHFRCGQRSSQGVGMDWQHLYSEPPWVRPIAWLDRLSWRSGPKQLIPLSGAGSHPWTWQRPHWEMWKIPAEHAKMDRMES